MCLMFFLISALFMGLGFVMVYVVYFDVLLNVVCFLSLGVVR